MGKMGKMVTMGKMGDNAKRVSGIVEIMAMGITRDCTRLGLDFIDIRGIFAKGSVVREAVES